MKQLNNTLYSLNKDGSLQQWCVFIDDTKFTVVFGKQGSKLQSKDTLCEQKNVGRSNETSVAEQVLLEAQSKYQDQIRKGYKEDITKISIDKTRVMLASDASKKPYLVNYPCHIMPKYDGNRMLVTFDHNKDPIFHSRGAKTYPSHAHIAVKLKELHIMTGFNTFDGELYAPGLPLQEIVSLVKKPQPKSIMLEYRIYDVPSDKPWIERAEDLRQLYNYVDGDIISVTPFEICYNEQQVKKSIVLYMQQGYEGTIIRNFKGKYEYGQRSNDLLKWKVFESDEALVLNVECDKNNEGVLECRLKSGIDFKCKMKGSHEERLYENQLLNIGKHIMFTYQTLTVDGVPQFPVGQCIRDVNSKWEPVD